MQTQLVLQPLGMQTNCVFTLLPEQTGDGSQIKLENMSLWQCLVVYLCLYEKLRAHDSFQNNLGNQPASATLPICFPLDPPTGAFNSRRRVD